MKYPNLLSRFTRYVKMNTRSDEKSTTTPTTQGQVEFANLIKRDLERMKDVQDIEYNSENGFLTATLPQNIEGEFPVIGFIAHLDTADYPAENIIPLIHERYNGKDIMLNPQVKLSVEEFPNLKDYIGETLITTDGTTLLGADDKSGICEILSAVEYLIEHPEIPHGTIKMAFGPDEEIGRGADLFDAKAFAADYAYTIDSGRVGHFEYETFNAAQAKITFEGTSVHPGTAKGQMVNALKLAHQLDNLLPQNEVPEKTEGYEGFYLQTTFAGSIDEARTTYIIRDHDMEMFLARKKFLEDKIKEINTSLDKERITVEMSDEYYNMREIIEDNFYVVDLALESMKAIGIEPIVTPFRGGTDGSKISFMGLPTPNIFTGAENLHGKFEFVTLESMEKAVETIIEISRRNTEK